MAVTTKVSPQVIWQEAVAAGHAAFAAVAPVPMIVGTPTHPLGNDINPAKPVYYVADGVCGFAWVKVKPATSSFAKWLKANGKVTGTWGGGYNVYASQFSPSNSQSYERKFAAAAAVAEVFSSYGIKSYAEGRLD